MNPLNYHNYYNRVDSKTTQFVTNTPNELYSTITKIGKIIISGLSSIFQSNMNLSKRLVTLLTISSVILPVDTQGNLFKQKQGFTLDDFNNIGDKTFADIQLISFSNSNVMIGWTNKVSTLNSELFVKVFNQISPYSKRDEIKFNDDSHHLRSDLQLSTISIGSAVAVWVNQPISGITEIRGQLLWASGKKIRNSFRLDGSENGHKSSPGVAGRLDGHWMAVWSTNNHTIEGKVFVCDGNLTDIINISSGVMGVNSNPSIAILEDLSFVICWFNSNKSQKSIYWRQISSTFESKEKHRLVTNILGVSANLNIISRTDGGFMVMFQFPDKIRSIIVTPSMLNQVTMPNQENKNISCDDPNFTCFDYPPFNKTIISFDTTRISTGDIVLSWIEKPNNQGFVYSTKIFKNGTSSYPPTKSGEDETPIETIGVTKLNSGGFLTAYLSPTRIEGYLNCPINVEQDCITSNSVKFQFIDDLICNTPPTTPPPTTTPAPPTSNPTVSSGPGIPVNTTTVSTPIPSTLDDTVVTTNQPSPTPSGSGHSPTMIAGIVAGGGLAFVLSICGTSVFFLRKKCKKVDVVEDDNIELSNGNPTSDSSSTTVKQLPTTSREGSITDIDPEFISTRHNDVNGNSQSTSTDNKLTTISTENNSNIQHSPPTDSDDNFFPSQKDNKDQHPSYNPDYIT